MNLRIVNTIQHKTKNLRIRKNIVRVNESNNVKVKSYSKKAVKDIDVDSASEDLSNDLLDIEAKDIRKLMKCQYGGYHKKLCDNETCEFCWNRSFASSNKAQMWSDKNKVKHREVCLSSHEKYLFDCNVCNHEIEHSPDSIKSGRWCGICNNKILCSDNNCELCKNKSFLSSDKAIYWSKNNTVIPREIFRSSHTKYLFDCDICNHTFKSSPNIIERNKFIPNIKTIWCPYCAHNSLCMNKNYAFCWENSFASSRMALWWSNKNKIFPREVFKSSSTGKYIFNCNSCGNEYISTLGNITSNGTWCPCTKNNKSETKLKDWFLTNNIDICSQIRFEFCKNPKTNRYLPFDFVLKSLKIIIELDGDHHFKQVASWASPEKTMKNDVYKMKCAIENGYTIIRLLQEDIWYDKNGWEQRLKSCINTRILENKLEKVLNIRTKKQYYFLCSNREYLAHEILLNMALLKK